MEVAEIAWYTFLGHISDSQTRWGTPAAPWHDIAIYARVSRRSRAHMRVLRMRWGWRSWLARDRILATIWRWWMSVGTRKFHVGAAADASMVRPRLHATFKEIRETDAMDTDMSKDVWVPQLRHGLWSISWILVFLDTSAQVAIHLRDGTRMETHIVTPRACRSQFGNRCAEIDLYGMPTSGMAPWLIMHESLEQPNRVRNVVVRQHNAFNRIMLPPPAKVRGSVVCDPDCDAVGWMCQWYLRMHWLLRQRLVQTRGGNTALSWFGQNATCREQHVRSLRMLICDDLRVWYRDVIGDVRHPVAVQARRDHAAIVRAYDEHSCDMHD